ncbi:hypothetical protein BZM27_52255 [Paraburkholderia steynii]|uniref:Uncharacterized protein n=1 Tax=Paraburkholderia steynii TaxID=1245441 RepID=A0A4R0X2N2_9BURK|nr:hypothetical protein BZM27_52255 [Paraburkholderia steynii]
MRKQPLQRLWRDFHAISHHMAFAVPSILTAGRRAIGLGPAEGDMIATFDWVERTDAYAGEGFRKPEVALSAE